MKIKDIMSRDVAIASVNDSVQEAAKTMARIDSGVLPVSENEKLVGMVTDRDISLRCVAAGKHPGECKVGEVMTRDVKYVYEDESTADLARNMAELQVRRLPVMSREKRLVGIVSIADLANGKATKNDTHRAISGVSAQNGRGATAH